MFSKISGLMFSLTACNKNYNFGGNFRSNIFLRVSRDEKRVGRGILEGTFMSRGARATISRVEFIVGDEARLCNLCLMDR
jgi:hypothetical protein